MGRRHKRASEPDQDLALGAITGLFASARGPVRFGKGWYSICLAANTRAEVEAMAIERAQMMGVFEFVGPAQQIQTRRDDNLYRVLFVVRARARRGFAGGSIVTVEMVDPPKPKPRARAPKAKPKRPRKKAEPAPKRKVARRASAA